MKTIHRKHAHHVREPMPLNTLIEMHSPVDVGRRINLFYRNHLFESIGLLFTLAGASEKKQMALTFCLLFRMPAPQMDGSGPRSELQELQVKSQQVADEVNIN